MSGIVLDLSGPTAEDLGETSPEGFVRSPWSRVDCDDEFNTVLYLCDVRFPPREEEPKEVAKEDVVNSLVVPH